MSDTSISYLWREPKAEEGFTAAVSLHSHTNQSKETLDFIAEMSRDWPILQPIMSFAENRSAERTGIRPNYGASYWTPPLTPKLAFDLETKQIEDQLQLPALVSLTDHDDIKAPMLLRTIPRRGIFPCRWSGPCLMAVLPSTLAFTICLAPPGRSGTPASASSPQFR